jgi:carbamoyltransferase
VQDGKVIAAGQEERFTRKKHDASFLKKNAVEFFLKQGGINTSDLDYVGFYDKPLQVVFFGVLAQVILPFLALSFYH